MLKLDNTVLVVIDIQSKLWNVMHDKEDLLANAQKLVRGMQVMGVPIILTEQNPQGLGPTVPELMQTMPQIKPLPKFCFNCWQEKDFQDTVLESGCKQVLICGIETHICVYQTALEMLSSGFEVYVVGDVVSSRVVRNRDIALSRLQSEGARLTVTEMAIYELMQTAKSPHFKEMLKVIK